MSEHKNFEKSMEARGFTVLARVTNAGDEAKHVIGAIKDGFATAYVTSVAEYDGEMLLWGKPKSDMPEYKAKIIARLDRQIAKGQEKYDTPLEGNTELTVSQRVEHLAEELTDGLQYIEHFNTLRHGVIMELAEHISRLTLKAGRHHDDELLDIAKGLNSLAKKLA